MNEHKKIKELLVDFALGELSKEQANQVRAHLTKCPECRSEIKRLEALLECTDQIRKSSPDEQACESARQTIFQVVENQKIKQTSGPTVSLEYIRKTIMKNPITKFTAAAVILIVAVMILHNSSVDMTTSVYAQMRENIKRMLWIHINTKGIYKGKEVELEQWFSDGEKVIALKKSDGELEFSDYKEGEKYVYDPNKQMISLSFIDQNDYARNAMPLQNGIDSMLSILTQRGADIVYHPGEFQGKEVEIYEVRYNVDKITMNGKIYVNLQNRLPIVCDYKAKDANGNQTTAWMKFEFPENGPKNIYDIGAPVSAKAPAQDLQKVLEAYLSHRKNSTQHYIAIVTVDQWHQKIWTFNIVYNDGKIQRKETRTTDEFKQQWEQYSRQKDIPFESLLELTQKGGTEYHSISLYVDGKSYWAYRNQNQPWKISEQRSEGPNQLTRDDLAGLAWPIFSNMQNEGTLIENDYSRKNNLICIQQLQQGEKMPEGHPDTVHLPSKRLCYLNPNRDYICERIEYHSLKNAPWQKDKSWLEGVDPNKLYQDSSNITEVTKYRQTKEGKWYPYKIEFRISPYDPNAGEFQPYSLHDVKTVYLQTNPEFPEGIFDPNNLPKQEN
jgi:hypothetical protein